MPVAVSSLVLTLTAGLRLVRVRDALVGRKLARGATMRVHSRRWRRSTPVGTSVCGVGSLSCRPGLVCVALVGCKLAWGPAVRQAVAAVHSRGDLGPRAGSRLVGAAASTVVCRTFSLGPVPSIAPSLVSDLSARAVSILFSGLVGGAVVRELFSARAAAPCSAGLGRSGSAPGSGPLPLRLTGAAGLLVLFVDWMLLSWMSLVPPGWKVGASAQSGDAAGLSSTVPNTAGASGFPCAVVNSFADDFLLGFWREFGGDRGDNLFKPCGLLPTPVSHSAGGPLSPAWTRLRRSLSLHASSSNLILLLASCTPFHWLAV